MANTNVTVRIDETLKVQLQELLSNLGMDMTTGIYGLQAYKLAIQNTNYSKEGKAAISYDDEWNNKVEWDDMFEQMKNRKVSKQKTNHFD